MALTTAGRDWIIDKIQDLAPLSNAPMTYIGWGTTATAEAVGDVQLAAEATEARVVGVLSQPTANTDRLVGTVTCNATGKTVVEVGRFNKVDNGAGRQMQQRHIYTGIPVQQNDAVTYTLDLVD